MKQSSRYELRQRVSECMETIPKQSIENEHWFDLELEAAARILKIERNHIRSGRASLRFTNQVS